jgi:hypothetical protein
MATTFTMRDEINCTPERFWELFWDAELQKRIFLEELGFPKWEVVSHEDRDSEIVRVVKAVPKLDAPAAVTKVLGSGFGYTEEGRYDKATKTYRFAIKPSTLADKLKNEGTVKCEAKGDAKCTRIVEVLAEAKIMMIGGMIEKMTEKSTRDGWAMSARIFNKILAEKA